MLFITHCVCLQWLRLELHERCFALVSFVRLRRTHIIAAEDSYYPNREGFVATPDEQRAKSVIANCLMYRSCTYSSCMSLNTDLSMRHGDLGSIRCRFVHVL